MQASKMTPMALTTECKRGDRSVAFMRRVAPGRTKESMLYWIAEACGEARAKRGRRHSHIAAELDCDQFKNLVRNNTRVKNEKSPPPGGDGLPCC